MVDCIEQQSILSHLLWQLVQRLGPCVHHRTWDTSGRWSKQIASKTACNWIAGDRECWTCKPPRRPFIWAYGFGTTSWHNCTKISQNINFLGGPIFFGNFFCLFLGPFFGTVLYLWLFHQLRIGSCLFWWVKQWDVSSLFGGGPRPEKKLRKGELLKVDKSELNLDRPVAGLKPCWGIKARNVCRDVAPTVWFSLHVTTCFLPQVALIFGHWVTVIVKSDVCSFRWFLFVYILDPWFK